MDTIYCVECPKELKLPETDRVRKINNNNKPFCDIFFPRKHLTLHSNTQPQTAEEEKTLPCTHKYTHMSTVHSLKYIAPTVTWPGKEHNTIIKTAVRLTAKSTFNGIPRFLWKLSKSDTHTFTHSKVILFVKREIVARIKVKQTNILIEVMKNKQKK